MNLKPRDVEISIPSQCPDARMVLAKLFAKKRSALEGIGTPTFWEFLARKAWL